MVRRWTHPRNCRVSSSALPGVGCSAAFWARAGNHTMGRLPSDALFLGFDSSTQCVFSCPRALRRPSLGSCIAAWHVCIPLFRSAPRASRFPCTPGRVFQLLAMAFWHCWNPARPGAVTLSSLARPMVGSNVLGCLRADR